MLRLTQQLATLRAEAATKSGNAQPGATSAAVTGKPEKKKGGLFGDALAKMMEDPSMKKMKRQQQMVMMDSMYGPLFKQLGLSPEETEKFKELLIDGQMKGVEGAGALFSGERDPAERTEAIKAMGEQQKQLDEQLKAFLGDERYSLQMQRFGMSMAIQFMGGKKSDDTAPVNAKP